MKTAFFPIMPSVLALVLFLGLTVGCEPIPTPIAVTGVSLDKTSLSLVEGSSETLTATVSPDNADNKTVSWKSSDTGIVTVDNDGKVTAVKAGSAAVTVMTSDGGKTATCSVTVTEAYIAVSSVQVTPETAELEVGQTLALTVTVLPADATDKTATWKSDNESVATVSEKGVVTGVAEGTTTIIVNVGEKSATCQVTVKPSIYEMERSALIEFYQALDGDHWKDNTNWCSDKPVFQWYGVRTDSKGRVSWIELSANGLKGIIPECIGNLEALTYLHLGVNYEISGPIPESIGKLVNLKTLALFENKLTGTIPESIMNLTELESFIIYQNQLDGNLSEKLYYSDWWVTRYFRMDQQDGYGLKFERIYESTDYSKHGEVQVLKTHSKGTGMKLVITADGFTDRMYADGKFDLVVHQAVEAFFEEEPYSQLRDYFDVYTIAAVSKNEVLDYDYFFESRPRPEGRMYGITTNQNKVKQFIEEQLNIKCDETVTSLLLVNKNNGCISPITYMYSNDYAVSIVGAGDIHNVKHEAAGHGFGKLADEYYHNSPYTGNLHEEFHQRGWFLNIDDTDDPSKVLWRAFLEDPYYEREQIGIYLGAYYNNLYKSTRHSIMQNGANGFNPPSRWVIYKRVKKLAGEECSFEEFLEFDKGTSNNLMESRSTHWDISTNNRSPIICDYPSSEIGMH